MYCEITHKNIWKQLCLWQENGSVGRDGFIDDTLSPKGNEECISRPVSGATSTEEDAISRSFRIQSLLLRVPTRLREERKTFHLQVRVRECVSVHSTHVGVGWNLWESVWGLGSWEGKEKCFTSY